MTTELTRPPSLRDFLDQGGDLIALDNDGGVWLEELVYSLYLHYMLVPQWKREERAAYSRHNAEEMLRTGEGLVPFADGSRKKDPEGLQRLITLYLWEAELYEDEELQERFKAGVPRILIEQHEERYQKALRPHPLELRVPENWWQCQHCGTIFDQGTTEAVIIGYQKGWNDDFDHEDELTYCRDCISMAAKAVTVKA